MLSAWSKIPSRSSSPSVCPSLTRAQWRFSWWPRVPVSRRYGVQAVRPSLLTVSRMGPASAAGRL
eukprot:12894732-Prorocentrum_lima.AAC.1